MRDSLGDALNGDGDDELFPFGGRPSEIDSRRKGVTNADFAEAVASLAAKIREATNMRIGSLDVSPPVLGIAANNDGSSLLSMSAPLPDFDWAGAFGPVSNSAAMGGGETVDSSSLDLGHPLANGPARSSSPVLNERKSGKFIPSLNLWKRGVSGALNESRKGGEVSPSSSEGTPKSDSKTRGAPRRESHLQRNGSKAANPDSQPGVATSAKAATSASLPKLTSSTGSGAQLNGSAAQRSGSTEQAAASKLPSLTQTQSLQTQNSQVQNPQTQSGRPEGPIVPRLPLGALSARRYDAEGAAGTERLAKALGIAFASQDTVAPSSQSVPTAVGDKAPGDGGQPGTSTGEQNRRDRVNDSLNGPTKSTFETVATTSYQSDHELSAQRPGFVTDRALSSAPAVSEPPGSVTERGTASTSALANGDESRETFSKRDFLAMRLEQSRQLQHLQALYE